MDKAFDSNGATREFDRQGLGPGRKSQAAWRQAIARRFRDCCGGFARNADFQSAISPICNRQAVASGWMECRLQTCDTTDWKSALRLRAEVQDEALGGSSSPARGKHPHAPGYGKPIK